MGLSMDAIRDAVAAIDKEIAALNGRLGRLTKARSAMLEAIGETVVEKEPDRGPDISDMKAERLEKAKEHLKANGPASAKELAGMLGGTSQSMYQMMYNRRAEFVLLGNSKFAVAGSEHDPRGKTIPPGGAGRPADSKLVPEMLSLLAVSAPRSTKEIAVATGKHRNLVLKYLSGSLLFMRTEGPDSPWQLTNEGVVELRRIRESA